MAFKLFKKMPDGELELTSFDDLQNKAFWCAHGEKQELAFVEVMKNLRKPTPYVVSIHPEKVSDPFHPDLLVQKDGISEAMIGEVKIKNSPLFFGEKKYGIPAQHALTMDLKDSFNYLNWLRKGVDITIFIWVCWEAHCMKTEFNGKTKSYEVLPMKGIWVTKFSALRKLEEKSPPPIHWYNEPFRHPPIYSSGQEEEWCRRLIQFDCRLEENGYTKNITSRGYMKAESGEMFPAGHSSASYVFDLNNESVFQRLVYKLG